MSNSYKVIDENTWPRAMHCAVFRESVEPAFCVTFEVDVTRFLDKMCIRDRVEKVSETAKTAPVLRSANMSLGVNVLLKLVQEAAQVLASAGFDIEILEKHHNQKVDAPSGTALALADSINEAMGGIYHYKYDRSTERVKRDQKEIGIQAVRGGTIVGEHDVIFAGKDEVITFNHTAYSLSLIHISRC